MSLHMSPAVIFAIFVYSAILVYHFH